MVSKAAANVAFIVETTALSPVVSPVKELFISAMVNFWAAIVSTAAANVAFMVVMQLFMVAMVNFWAAMVSTAAANVAFIVVTFCALFSARGSTPLTISVPVMCVNGLSGDGAMSRLPLTAVPMNACSVFTSSLVFDAAAHEKSSAEVHAMTAQATAKTHAKRTLLAGASARLRGVG